MGFAVPQAPKIWTEAHGKILLDSASVYCNTLNMEVQFTAEQELRLGQIASVEGVAPARLVQEAALLLIEDDERFRAGVRKGIEQADQGLFIEESEGCPRQPNAEPLMRLRWTSVAADDLESIRDYLALHLPSFTQSTILEIYQAILTLRSTPFRGRAGREEGTHELVLPRLPYIVSIA